MAKGQDCVVCGQEAGNDHRCSESALASFDREHERAMQSDDLEDLDSHDRMHRHIPFGERLQDGFELLREAYYSKR